MRLIHSHGKFPLFILKLEQTLHLSCWLDDEEQILGLMHSSLIKCSRLLKLFAYYFIVYIYIYIDNMCIIKNLNKIQTITFTRDSEIFETRAQFKLGRLTD